MKSVFGYLAGATLSLWLLSPVQAQPPGAYGVGTCTSQNMINGRNIAGITELYVGRSPNDGALIPSSLATGVFNQAECQCQSRDIKMHVTLTSAAGPGVTPGSAMYIGDAGCADPAKRALGLCYQITASHPPNNRDWILDGNWFEFITPFDVVIPPEVVTNPKSMNNFTECATSGMQTYTVTLSVGPDTGAAVCSLPVAVNGRAPQVELTVSATSCDGGLTVNWSVPTDSNGIDSYQVLCRKTSDPTRPAMSEDFLEKTHYYFSSCIDKHMFRRTIGELNTGNAAATSTHDVPIHGPGFPIDPRLRCSDRIMATGTSLHTRLSGLENNQTYELLVLAIDTFGNATASPVIIATPQAHADSCCGSDCAGFGCQASQSVPGPAVASVAPMLLGLLLWAHRRRTRWRVNRNHP